MDLNSIINMATSALDRDRDGQLEIHEIMHALGPLLSSGQQALQNNGAQAGGLDLSSLINTMQQNGLGSIAQSWLGDGANQPVSGEQLQATLGQEKIDAFAQQTGMNHDQALHSLQEILPTVVDKSSQGGELLANQSMNNDALLGIIGSLASSFLKR